MASQVTQEVELSEAVNAQDLSSEIGHQSSPNRTESAAYIDPQAEKRGPDHPLGQMNPDSPPFHPPTSPVRTMPDLSNLNLSDSASSHSSPQTIAVDSSLYARRKGMPNDPESPQHSWSSPASPSTPFYSSASTQSTAWSVNLPMTPKTPTYYDVFYQEAPFSVEKKDAQSAHLDQEPLASVQPSEIGRYLMINQFPPDTTREEAYNLLKRFGEPSAISLKHLYTKGCALVIFYDSRDAVKAYQTLRANKVRLSVGGIPRSLQCMKVSRDTIERDMGLMSETAMDNSFSEAVVVVDIIKADGVDGEKLKSLLASFGDLDWFQELGGGRKFLAEFYDTRHARNCVEALKGHTLQDSRLSINFRSKDPFNPTEMALSKDAPSYPARYTLGSAAYQYSLPPHQTFRHTTRRSESGLGNDRFSSSGYAGYPSPPGSSPSWTNLTGDYPTAPPASPSSSIDHSSYYQVKITPGRDYRSPQSHLSSPPHLESLRRRMDDPAVLQGLLNNVDISARVRQGEGLGAPYDPRDKKRIPEENRVIPQRILSGLDHRTTVMVKDVPNKLSRRELVEILSEVVPGEFDFVYLRFDFHNCCNVGYAFVNFTNVNALYTFIQAKVGKKWNLFGSEKVLQVSYANIQGKAALINKFRNSAVMSVMEQWRPQIFYSGGAMKGQPEPFPDSDSLANRQRSTESPWSSMTNSTPSAHLSPTNIYEYEYANSVFDRRF